MISPVNTIVEKYLDWKAFRGEEDPELEVYSGESELHELTYGIGENSRVKTFNSDEEVIEFFNSRLKPHYQEPGDFTVGSNEEFQRSVDRSAGGIGSRDGEWAVDIPEALEQVQPWIERDAYQETGPVTPGVVMVRDPENMEEAIEEGIKHEMEKRYRHAMKLQEEFGEQTENYIEAATTRAVAEASTEEETASVEWYKELLDDL
ncbi:MAG: hypothetical protein ABEK10_02700 [Candidatus Nanosalina sp.]